MFEIALQATNLLGTGLLSLMGFGLALLLGTLVVAEQVRGLQRAEAQAFVPTAWKRALAGSWSLRGRIRRQRSIRFH